MKKEMRKFIVIISLIAYLLVQSVFAVSVKVGVIDTGVKIRDGVIDADKILEGKNYVSDNNDTSDVVGHGTRVTSLITGTLDGEISSPCSESVVVPLVYYTKLASGVVMNEGVDSICSAIYDAVDVYGCKIINISSGIPSDDERMRQAVDYAEEKGVLIVSAVGNSGNEVYYPAAYDTVIAVGSHNDKNEPSGFSCRGAEIDLLARGENIKAVSIKNAAEYEEISGTSYSAAIITAYAAAALERYPELVPYQIRYIMEASCTDICDVGYDEISGYGIFEPELFYENLKLFGSGEMLCFYDVSPDDWFYDSVLFSYNNGLINGSSSGFFRPEEEMTGAMLVTLLYWAESKAAARTANKDNASPADGADEAAYYADAAAWAQENNIIAEESQSYFEPDNYITREEMICAVKRYADYKGVNTDLNGDLSVFDDEEEIGENARESVSWAYAAGLIKGRENNMLAPCGNITRAEAVTVLQRFMSRFSF